MVNWNKAMQQTFEYYIVDPNTWKDKEKFDNVISSTITRDMGAETLGSLTLSVDKPVEECYIREYLIVKQDGYTYRFPLGTHIIQTPSYSFDGKTKTTKIDAYTPLIELKEKKPPIGYTLMKGSNILEQAYRIIRENARAPIIKIENDKTLTDDFVAKADDTWLTFILDLLLMVDYRLDLDPLGRILFAPVIRIRAMQPVTIFNDDNSSILLPKIDVTHDIYGVPNVVEIIYSSANTYLTSKVVNDDENSSISIRGRGREIIYREINPSGLGLPTQEQLDIYASNKLKSLSNIEHNITYEHGYYPVSIGECVMLNYTRAGLNNSKVIITKQVIKCEPGCPVSETAIYKQEIWR